MQPKTSRSHLLGLEEMEKPRLTAGVRELICRAWSGTNVTLAQNVGYGAGEGTFPSPFHLSFGLRSPGKLVLYP
jgi:hypothetical protein